jgi:hypothetical protein
LYIEITPFYFPPLSGDSPRNKGRLFIASGCGSMRIVVDWFRGNYDNYFEIYEVEDEEFLEDLFSGV